MSDPNLKMRFFGDSADAERALVALEKKYEKLEGQIKGASAASKRGSKGMGDQMAGVAMKIGSVVAGYASIQAAIGAVVRENERYIASIERVKDLIPEGETKLQIQSGGTREETIATRKVIKDRLLITPSATLDEGINLQRQLVSSGFNAADVNSGAALGAVLDLKAATNQFGKDVGDPMGAVLSVSQFLKAQGKEANAANVRATGGKIAQIFEGSDIQFGDFSELAQVSSTLTGLNLTENEQIAGFSSMVDVMPAATAKTQFKTVASRLRSAGDMARSADAVRSLGLEPEDVDLIGETFSEAIARLGTAGDAADEKTRSSALLAIFGQEAQGGAQLLLNQRGLIGERMGKLEGNAFERGVSIFQRSNYAGEERIQVETDFDDAAQLDLQGGIGDSTVQKAINRVVSQRMIGAGQGERFMINSQAAALRTSVAGNQMLGWTPMESVEDVASVPFLTGGMAVDVLKELQKISSNTQPALNRNPQGE